MSNLIAKGIQKVEKAFAPAPTPAGPAPTSIDPVAVLKQLSSEEKIALLSGDDMWHTAPVKRLGVPRVRVSPFLPNVLDGLQLII
jgi:beta-glucosidase